MDSVKRRFFLLEKQNLLKKKNSDNILDFIKHHIGLHSTDYLTPYFSLQSRLKDFNPAELFDLIVKKKDVVRFRAYRATLFILHKDDITLAIESTREHRIKRITEGKKLFKNAVDFDEFEQKLLSTLSGRQMTNKELFEELGTEIPKEIFRFIVQITDTNGLIVRTKQRYITDKTIRYGLVNEWISSVKQQVLTEEDAIRKIFLRYVKLFGPVCLEDFCWWLPTKKTIAKEILDDFSDKLEMLDIDGIQYFMLKDDYRILEDFDFEDYPEIIVNFLPYEDHFAKGYKKRDWYISDEVKSKLFGVKGIDRGEIRPSIWLNGEIVGRWEYEWIDKKKTAMKIVIPYLNDRVITDTARELIEQNRVELENFTNEKLVPLIKMR